jgi:hypothetical protein
MWKTLKSYRWMLGVVILVGSAAGLWFATRPHRDTRGRPVVTAEERAAEKLRLLDEWQAARAVPISSAELDRVIDQTLSAAGTMSPPPAGTKFDSGDLSAEQRADLSAAVRGWLRAYSGGTIDNVLSYMTDRGETPDADAVAVLKECVGPAPGRDPAAVNRLSGPATMRAYWTAFCERPGWEAVLDGQGDTLLWTTAQVPGDDAEKKYFAQHRDNTVFANIVNHRHMFRPSSSSLPAALKQNGRVLLADVRVVIKYETTRFGEPRPHFLRLWYDPQSRKWHPLSMYLVCTVSQGYPSVLF